MKRVQINNHVSPLTMPVMVLAMAFTFFACSGGGGGGGSCEGDDCSMGGVSSGGGGSSSSSGEALGCDWMVTTAPTCDEEGTEIRICDGVPEARSIAKLDWNAQTTTAPTCDTKGEETMTCPGGASETQKRPIDETPYDKATYFCLRHKLEKFCGSSKREYDPGKYECKPGSNGVYLKEKLKDARDGKEYEAVLIGEQVWMAENLNYAGENSEIGKCYDYDSGKCDTYGRLYNWSTAMALSANCNSNMCASQAAKYMGICPEGWHLPRAAEWNALMSFIHTDNDLSSFSSGTSTLAGRHLKARSGWGSNGNGLDSYGFAALPGGGSTPDGYFVDAGNGGCWWSASDNVGGNAYRHYMGYNGEYAMWGLSNKTLMFSVRCLQD